MLAPQRERIDRVEFVVQRRIVRTKFVKSSA